MTGSSSTWAAPDYERYLCFPQTYDEGRRWFRDAVAWAGGELRAETNPHGLTPEGEPLTTDIGWFGPRDAERVLLSISGTHGQEYFCGAAGQLDWIATGGPSRLDSNLAVCLVHAHNPYGAAWLSRGNENFVDLNRNYFNHDRPVRPNPLYGELFDLLFTAKMDEHVLDDVMAGFYAFVARTDPVAAMTAMGGGQQTHPTGTLYCGSGPEWSTETLRGIVRRDLSRAKKVVVIDWHTGLGEFGKPTFLAEFATGSPAKAWVDRWWSGAERNTELSETARPEVIGNVCVGVGGDLRAAGVEVVDSVIELGTFANQGVLAALLIDRWLRFACPNPAAPAAVALRTQMMERLNPSNPEWRVAVVEAMRDIYDRTLAGLAAWD